MAFKRLTRLILRRLFQNREQFELWAGLTFFTLSLALFIAGWTFLRGTVGEWVSVPAGLCAALGLLGLSAKVPISGLILNRGLVAYEPKRGGQVAVLYGASLFGLGVFGLSSLPYGWLEPSGSYGLAALLGAALILGGLYIVASTPILEPSEPVFEADHLDPAEAAVPWYVVDEQELESEKPAAPLLPRSVEPRYAVPQVRAEAAAKRPSMLSPADIVAYAMIECDWLETPSNYSCIVVEHSVMAPVVETGDIVGINHAIVDPNWLRGKMVAAYTERNGVALGFLQETQEGWRLQPRDESVMPVSIEPVALIGAVEWSLKPGSKNIRPADAVYESSAANAHAAEHARQNPPPA